MTTATYTPTTGSTIHTGQDITVVWGTILWPLEYLTIRVNEKFVYSYTNPGGDPAGALTSAGYSDGYEATIEYDSLSGSYTFVFQPSVGWLTSPLTITTHHQLLNIPVSEGTQTASYTVNITDSFKADHVEEGIALLLGQFQDDATKLQALLTSFMTQIQAFESEAHPLLLERDLYTATGDRLDGLGQIVGEERQGRSDTIYRIRIIARLAVIKSSGTAEELINILQLITNQDTPADIWYREYYPKTVYIRAKNYTPPDPPELIGGLLRAAKPAGTKLVYIYAEDADDTNLFTFDSGPGLDQGKLAGDA